MSAQVQELEKKISAIEAVLSRIEGKLGGSGGSSDSKWFIEWDALVNRHINAYLERSKVLGGDVAEQAQLVEKTFKEFREFLLFAASNKRPADSKFQELLAPISKNLGEVKEFKEKRRTSKQSHHLAAIAEGISCLAWVCEGRPAPYVNDIKGSSEFWSNKILVEFKNKDENQVEWVKSWNNFMKELAAYVKDFHPSGLTWGV